jgi:5-methylthioadenosine/S-adenosylhomocysteine deaminase
MEMVITYLGSGLAFNGCIYDKKLLMRKYLLLLVMLSANYISGFTQTSFQANATPIILRGTIILPEGVIQHGYVGIVNGRIVSVSENSPDLPNAVSVNTHGIILPGFVDAHNHLRANVVPRWKPSRIYSNRYEWRQDPEFLRLVNGPISRVGSTNFCDMNKWGELRALAGGTTSIMTTQAQPCIYGMVRNLDYNSGFYGTTELNLEHIFNVLDLPIDPAERVAFVGAAHFFIANPFYESLLIHLAEGTDALSLEEFTFMQSQSLLNPKGVVIHGIPLRPADFQAMSLNGTSLVWSPRSNLELYGATANIGAALDAGVEIALAPDWAVTGSSNILNELKVASLWNNERLGGRITDRQLVDMATSIPAHIAGIDDEVGAIRVGLRADILVINGDHNNPYRAIINATAADVELVFINGVPIYGDRIFMKHFWEESELEKIESPETTKTLATPAVNFLVSDIENRLQIALQAEGTLLAPLTEANDFVLPAQTVARFPGQTNTANDIREEKTRTDKLTITALPNPSRNYFTLRIQSNSKELLQVKVMDVSGRIVETKHGMVANMTFHIGNNFRAGVYLVEVTQGNERQILKLIKQ